MQKTNLNYVLLFLTFLVVCCTVGPVNIAYDYDQCNECKMTISDSRFGCEIVTSKAKVYKYDAIECLVAASKKFTREELPYILVTDFDTPEKLIDARTAAFIRSSERPSPMGAFLSAYSNNENAVKALRTIEGDQLTWEDLNNELK